MVGDKSDWWRFLRFCPEILAKILRNRNNLVLGEKMKDINVNNRPEENIGDTVSGKVKSGVIDGEKGAALVGEIDTNKGAGTDGEAAGAIGLDYTDTDALDENLTKEDLGLKTEENR